jgi:hypothetical protein
VIKSCVLERQKIIFHMRIPSIRMACKTLILQQAIISRQIIKNQKIQ